MGSQQSGLKCTASVQWTHLATDRFLNMWCLNKTVSVVGVRMWASKIFLSTVFIVSFALP